MVNCGATYLPVDWDAAHLKTQPETLLGPCYSNKEPKMKEFAFGHI